MTLDLFPEEGGNTTRKQFEALYRRLNRRLNKYHLPLLDSARTSKELLARLKALSKKEYKEWRRHPEKFIDRMGRPYKPQTKILNLLKGGVVQRINKERAVGKASFTRYYTTKKGVKYEIILKRYIYLSRIKRYFDIERKRFVAIEKTKQ